MTAMTNPRPTPSGCTGVATTLWPTLGGPTSARGQELTLWLCLACAATCATPGATGPDASGEVGPPNVTDAIVGPAIAMDDLTAAFVAARCSAYDTCTPSPLWFASLDGCKKWLEAGLPFSNWLKWTKQGRTKYNADKSAACIAAAKGCATTSGFPSVCGQLFSPVVADKGKCDNSAQCISGSCQYSGWSGALSCGHCVPADTAPLGRSCAAWNCGVGTSCAGWPTPKCVKNGTGGVGNKCGGASCLTSLQCGKAEATGDYVCTAFGKVGEPCTNINRCASGLVCARTAPSDTRSFCRMPLSEGDACFQYDPPDHKIVTRSVSEYSDSLLAPSG